MMKNESIGVIAHNHRGKVVGGLNGTIRREGIETLEVIAMLEVGAHLTVKNNRDVMKIETDALNVIKHLRV